MDDLGTCEWWGTKSCARPATMQTGWGDIRLCHGHEIVAAANRASHGEQAITADEYVAQIERAKAWLKENPDTEVKA